MPECGKCHQQKPADYGRWFPGRDNKGFYTIPRNSWGCSNCNEETMKKVVEDLIKPIAPTNENREQERGENERRILAAWGLNAPNNPKAAPPNDKQQQEEAPPNERICGCGDELQTGEDIKTGSCGICRSLDRKEEQ